MKLEFSLLADAASLQGGTVNIAHGGANQFIGLFPLIVRQIAVVMFVEVDEEDIGVDQVFTFGMENAKGEITMFNGSATGTFKPSENPKAIIPVNIGTHTVPEPGEHWYIVYLNGEEFLRKKLSFHMKVHIPENKLVLPGQEGFGRN